jgi:hypothetical protein
MLGDSNGRKHDRYNSAQLVNFHFINIRGNIVHAAVSFLGLNQRDAALSNSAPLGLFFLIFMTSVFLYQIPRWPLEIRFTHQVFLILN